MASGFGWGGGRSRCFSYWQEFQKCYAQTDSPSECVPQSEDYIECLHHIKANQREQVIGAEFKRKMEQLQHEQAHAQQQKASPAPSSGGAADGTKQGAKAEESTK